MNKGENISWVVKEGVVKVKESILNHSSLNDEVDSNVQKSMWTNVVNTINTESVLVDKAENNVTEWMWSEVTLNRWNNLNWKSTHQLHIYREKQLSSAKYSIHLDGKTIVHNVIVEAAILSYEIFMSSIVLLVGLITWTHSKLHWSLWAGPNNIKIIEENVFWGEISLHTQWKGDIFSKGGACSIVLFLDPNLIKHFCLPAFCLSAPISQEIKVHWKRRKGRSFPVKSLLTLSI